MIFVDSNVPMYLVGADHPRKHDARRLLEAAIAAGERLVTDAEVLQEILHRSTAIGRRDAIEPAFGLTLAVVDRVLPVELDDVERAKALVVTTERLSARDAIHLAILQRYDVRRIMTFDRAFDDLPGIARLG